MTIDQDFQLMPEYIFWTVSSRLDNDNETAGPVYNVDYYPGIDNRFRHTKKVEN